MGYKFRQKDFELVSDAKLRLYANQNWVFMATLCSSLQTRLTTEVAYGVTDGKYLYINPISFSKLTHTEQVFLLAHETLHVAYMHMLRMKPNKVKWNMATDYVINLALVADGFDMIDGGLIEHKYRGLTADEVYELLPDDVMNNNPLADDLIPSDDDTDSNEIINKIIDASNVAKQANAWGSVPEDIRRELDNLIKPYYDWKAILRKNLYATKKYLNNWCKPNRRYLQHGIYLPTLDGKALTALIAVDVSSSINQEAVTAFISELYSLFKLVRVDKVELVQFNTRIVSSTTLTGLTDLKKTSFSGYGGTNIKPVIDYYNESKHKICLILTDGFFNNNFETKKNIIWLIYDNPHFSSYTGKVIHYVK